MWVLKLGEGGGERKMELRGRVVADVPGTHVSGCVGRLYVHRSSHLPTVPSCRHQIGTCSGWPPFTAWPVFHRERPGRRAANILGLGSSQVDPP